MDRLRGSSAGTRRRLRLPKWARHEMAGLEHEVAEARMGAESTQSQVRALAREVQQTRAALAAVVGFPEVHAVPVPEYRTEARLRTLFFLSEGGAEGAVALRPGDRLLVVRRRADPAVVPASELVPSRGVAPGDRFAHREA